jgi:histidyl-tRNA synthetase
LLYNGGKRLYYMGPMFRHERPQRGRYRQFHQIGAEALGFGGPELDAEVILMAYALCQRLGITDIELQINSLGQPHERNAHRSALIAHFEAHHDVLDAEAQRRLHLNPLRLLDSKNPAMQELIGAAPKLVEFLGEASKAHLAAVLGILDANGVAHTVNHRLVRGLDYYNLTVFEFVTTRLGAQGTICAGGRYDYLMEQIGGKPAPAVGWAMGMERVLELIGEQALVTAPLDVYAVVTDSAYFPRVHQCLQQLRQSGLSVQMQAVVDGALPGIKSQFKRADASGARYALIFGSDEMADGVVTAKALRDASVAQVRHPLDSVDQWAHSLQSAA